MSQGFWDNAIVPEGVFSQFAQSFGWFDEDLLISPEPAPTVYDVFSIRQGEFLIKDGKFLVGNDCACCSVGQPETLCGVCQPNTGPWARWAKLNITGVEDWLNVWDFTKWTNAYEDYLNFDPVTVWPDWPTFYANLLANDRTNDAAYLGIAGAYNQATGAPYNGDHLFQWVSVGVPDIIACSFLGALGYFFVSVSLTRGPIISQNIEQSHRDWYQMWLDDHPFFPNVPHDNDLLDYNNPAGNISIGTTNDFFVTLKYSWNPIIGDRDFDAYTLDYNEISSNLELISGIAYPSYIHYAKLIYSGVDENDLPDCRSHFPIVFTDADIIAKTTCRKHSYFWNPAPLDNTDTYPLVIPDLLNATHTISLINGA